MCVYSIVSDWGRKQFTDPSTLPGSYPPVVVPGIQITREQWEEYQKLLEAAKKFDDATGQPDCESEDKTRWIKDMEKKIAELERISKNVSKS